MTVECRTFKEAVVLDFYEEQFLALLVRFILRQRRQPAFKTKDLPIELRKSG
jgi:hypothetical protein